MKRLAGVAAGLVVMGVQVSGTAAPFSGGRGGLTVSAGRGGGHWGGGRPGGFGGRHGFGFHGGFSRFGYSYPAYYPYSFGGFYPYSVSGFYPYSLGGYFPYSTGYIGPPYGGVVGYYPRPDLVDVGPQVVIVQPPGWQAPPAREPEYERERPAPREERGGYYLERDRRRERPEEERRPASLLEVAKRQVRVEKIEGDQYLVRWLGPADDLAVVEFQAVDGTGQVLGSRLVKEAPFRGLLRVPEKTARVILSVEQKNGASASVKLPVAEFRALETEERVIK